MTACCRRHAAGLPGACGPLTAEDREVLRGMAREAIGDRDEGVFGHPPAAGRIAADLAAALLAALEQAEETERERDAALASERRTVNEAIEVTHDLAVRADIAEREADTLRTRLAAAETESATLAREDIRQRAAEMDRTDPPKSRWDNDDPRADMADGRVPLVEATGWLEID